MAKVNILWTNDNPLTSHFMVFMYATNAKLRGWWEEVDVLIWGATAKLVAEDEKIQERIKLAKEAGVRVVACIACARELGVVEKLESLDIEVFPLGEPLTNILKNGDKLITI